MTDPTAPLQFEKAEFTGAPPGAQCQVCAQPIAGEYFMLGEAAMCGPCKQQVSAAFTGGSGAARLMKASLFGVGAGLAGAAIWYAVEHLLDLHIGLVAILIGYLVGVSVRKGSENRGGLTYQLLAAFLTYCAICWSTIPDIVAAGGEGGVVFKSIFAFFFCLAVPFLGGFSAITLLIIAIGLWEGWRRNKPIVLTFLGPFTLTPVAEPPVPAPTNG